MDREKVKREIRGWAITIAAVVAFLVAVVNNFTWNRTWTFADSAQTDWRRQLVQFNSISLVGLAMNNIILLSLEESAGLPDWRTCVGISPGKSCGNRDRGFLELSCQPIVDIQGR